VNDDEHPWLARKRKARRRGSGNPDGDEAQAEGEEGDVEGEGDDAYLEEWLFDEEEEVEPWEFDDESPSYGDDGYDDADECEFDGVMREGDCSAVLSFIGQRLQATPLVLRDINDLSADELVKCGLSQAIAQRIVDERAGQLQDHGGCILAHEVRDRRAHGQARACRCGRGTDAAHWWPCPWCGRAAICTAERGVRSMSGDEY